MRNVFFEHHTQNMVEKSFSDPFLNQNWVYLWSWGLSKYIETVKSKKKSGTFSFSAWFLKKHISHVIFYYLTKFHCLVAFTSWDIGQYVYCNCLLTRLWRYKFWNWPYFSNQAVFSIIWPKSQDKNVNILRTKRAFKMK